MPTRETNRGRRLRFVPIFPFLFFGVVFVGGHGVVTSLVSLVVSALLTAGISLLIARRQRRRHEELLRPLGKD